MQVIIFSKDRPLQLRATLESLFYYSQISYDNVYIISVGTSSELEPDFSNCNWMIEEYHHFRPLLEHIVCKYHNDDPIMFSTDDAIFTDTFNISGIASFLEVHNDVIGFSLRLGKNINPSPAKTIEPNDEMFAWHWPSSPKHFGYPFDVTSGIYRRRLIQNILSLYPTIKTPNYLESNGVQYCFKNAGYIPECMASFNESKQVTLDINRVQDDFPNYYDGDENTSSEYLYKLFKQNKRIKWEALKGVQPDDPFIGQQGLIIDDNN